MAKREITGSQRLNTHARPPTPPRVAPRLRTEVKRMRVRDKKNSVTGKK